MTKIDTAARMKYLTRPAEDHPDIIPVEDKFTVELPPYSAGGVMFCQISHPEPKSQIEVLDFVSVTFGGDWTMPPSFDGVNMGEAYLRPNPNYSNKRWNWKLRKV